VTRINQFLTARYHSAWRTITQMRKIAVNGK
jgi:hypothetical protein